jgi:Zn-dependent oligopeptidase
LSGIEKQLQVITTAIANLTKNFEAKSAEQEALVRKSIEDTVKLAAEVEALKGNQQQVITTDIAKMTTKFAAKTAEQKTLVRKSIEDTAKVAAEVEPLKGNPVGLSGVVRQL